MVVVNSDIFARIENKAAYSNSQYSGQEKLGMDLPESTKSVNSDERNSRDFL